MKYFLNKLRRCQSGSAMTEFVIGLPVFILIFSGIGALYKLHHEILTEKARVSAALWQEADMGEGFVIPILGIVNSVGSLSDLAQNGANTLGIYADSGAKSTLPLLIPGTRPSSPCYTVSCALAGAPSNYFAHVLLNDNAPEAILNGGLSASGWANVLSSGLSITGSRPAFAAGIRYGEAFAEGQDVTIDTQVWGSYSFNTGKLDVPGVTQPTHRSFAVAITRIEFATDEVWNTQIPEFDDNFDTDTSDASGELDECTAAIDNYNNCLSDPMAPPGETQSEQEARCQPEAPGDACEDIGGNSGLGNIGAGWCTPGTPGC